MTPSTGIGIVLPPDLTASELTAFARRADDLGFDALWVVEDCFLNGGIAQAATALAVTRRLTVGLALLPAGARNPAFAAMEVATLARFHPGRLLVGVGHGMPDWMRQVGSWPTSPLTLLEEYLGALRALLAGERVTTEGRYVRLDGVRLAAPPERPPAVLAGVRGPRSLRVAGRAADGVLLAEPVTPEYLATAREQTAAPAGHLLVAYNIAAVADDGDAALEAARPALKWIGEPAWRPHLAPLPFADELTALRAAAGSPKEFTARLPDAWVQRLAVAGTPQHARAHLASLRRAGATQVVLSPAGPDPFAALDSLARLLRAPRISG
ncbi:LLM class flavin-dependent oxidoreductase [Streptomyces rochei]|uniref:LLM class flavin-dependent oxidoreductase n=1 Tax=Streptomyces rochei TaxID=1928 RepID=UPI0013BA369A|nr:LLM class flavin-dependent oxidoreductase [Streptomyces rochei]